jgi:hypothetical protein
MTRLKWWMRSVGALYLVNAVMMALVRAPIRSAGPEGTLDRAAAGEGIARFLVDTWVGFGLEVGAIGIVLLICSRSPRSAIALVWVVLGIELARGIIYDIYMIARGYEPMVYVPWILIHAVVIATGLLALQAARTFERNESGTSKTA